MSLAAVGDDGSDIPSRHEAEQLLDDPNPRGEIQRGFALRYLDYVEEDPRAYGFRDEADFDQFKEKYKERLSISDGDMVRNLAGAEDDVKYYYAKAKEDHDQLRADLRHGDRDAVNCGASALEAVRGRSSETSPGTANSNEILDAGLSGLRAFDVWLPLYNRSLGVTGGGAAVPIDEIYRLYDEQRDIPFDKFEAGAGEFATLRAAVADSSDDVAAKLQINLSSWQGTAADQARDYHRGFAEKTSVIADAIGTSADGLRHTLGSVGKFCQEKANWVLTYYFDSIGDITAQDLERLVRIAEGNGSQNDIIHCVGFLGIEAKNRFNDDWGDLDQDTVDFIAQQAGVWLREVFCTWFSEHLNNYRMMCENIRVAVDGAWNAFPDMLTQLPENPYSELGAAIPGQQPPAAGQASADGRGSGPGAGHGGGVVAPPGSGGTAAGATAPASTAAPEIPPVSPDSKTNPSTPRYPDPVTADLGVAPANGDVMPAGSEPDVLTISHGDHDLSLSVPDADGIMEITLSDGAGAPKGYTLDFAEQEPRHDAEFARAETPGPDPFPPEDQPYRPGTDGKIHIEDGNLRITVEKPDGPHGPTVATVDDGSGDPTTYTLGEERRPQSHNDQADHAAVPQAAPGLDAVVGGAAIHGAGPGSVPGDLGAGVPTSGADTGEVAPQVSPRAGLGVAPGGGATGSVPALSAGDYAMNGNIFDVGVVGNRISGTLDPGENRAVDHGASDR